MGADTTQIIIFGGITLLVLVYAFFVLKFALVLNLSASYSHPRMDAVHHYARRAIYKGCLAMATVPGLLAIYKLNIVTFLDMPTVISCLVLLFLWFGLVITEESIMHAKARGLIEDHNLDDRQWLRRGLSQVLLTTSTVIGVWIVSVIATVWLIYKIVL